MTNKQKKDIDNMTHEEMCRLYRFAPIGHPYFAMNTEAYRYFSEKFRKFGGMTSEMSKKIG